MAKSKSSFGLLKLVVLAAAGGGGYWWWKNRAAPPPAAAAITAKSAPKGASETIIPHNTNFNAGEDIWSPDRSCRLVFQKDGNIVLYRANGSVIWSAGSSGATHCFFGADGHFSASSYPASAPAKMHFSSGTLDGRGQTLRIRNGGSAVISDAAGNVLWSAPAGLLSGLSKRPIRLTRRPPGVRR